MSSKCRLFLFIMFCVISSGSYSQQKVDSSGEGTVVGVLRDSVNSYFLQSASLAIYKDSELVSYQLSNNFGEFRFTKIPIGIRLKIVAGYVGYQNISRYFIIADKSKTIDLGELNLERIEAELSEIIVTAVLPMRMKGDTLEFNADAFSLDENAVGEDLLRKLPGVTVWGDGTITVNGREVSQVLVDGKPFFGKDARIATQNIAKDAISKVQVYQKNLNSNNRLDSITEINIRLKEGRNFGYFGKISVGFGTDRHYEMDANINYFNKSTEIGVVGAGNNVNKIANDINTLMRNTTYKGSGANIDYQPDFNTQGLNKPNSAGIVFQHDFISNPDYYNNNRLSADYFIKNNTNTFVINSQSISILGKDSSQIKQDRNSDWITNTGQTFNLRYDKQKDNLTFYSVSSFNVNNSKNSSVRHSDSYGPDNVLQSTNNIENTFNSDSNRLSIQVGLKKQVGIVNAANRLPRNWDINYSINTGSNKSERNNITIFTLPSQSQVFDRRYHVTGNKTRQNLYASVGDLSKWMFGYKGFLSGFSMELKNTLDLDLDNSNSLVENGNTNGAYEINKYLSNNNSLMIINEQPILAISNVIVKELANRYQKMITIDFNAQGQFYQQKNESNHSFQNFTKSYRKFIPNASVRYSNNQYGDFRNMFRLGFSSTVHYPTVAQLYPLVDSSDQYNIQEGNPLLKEADNKELSLNFQHISQRTKNTFNYSLNIVGGIARNIFADSSMTDGFGRRTNFTVNADGNRYLNLSFNLNKAFKLKESQLQLSFLPSLDFRRNPNSINGVWNISNAIYNNHSLSIYYTNKDWWSINLKESFSYYHSKQSSIEDNPFNQIRQSTELSTSINYPKKFTLGTNITYNRNTSTGSDLTVFTIWNANAAYRFLSGNNLKLKVAAMDLLHQNTGVINYGSNNNLTNGTANVLQQYFMVSISFFPRQFGKNKKKESD